MSKVITDAGLTKGPAQPSPMDNRRARVIAVAKALREAKSDDEAADALEAAFLLGKD